MIWFSTSKHISYCIQGEFQYQLLDVIYNCWIPKLSIQWYHRELLSCSSITNHITWIYRKGHGKLSIATMHSDIVSYSDIIWNKVTMFSCSHCSEIQNATKLSNLGIYKLNSALCVVQLLIHALVLSHMTLKRNIISCNSEQICRNMSSFDWIIDNRNILEIRHHCWILCLENILPHCMMSNMIMVRQIQSMMMHMIMTND